MQSPPAPAHVYTKVNLKVEQNGTHGTRAFVSELWHLVWALGTELLFFTIIAKIYKIDCGRFSPILNIQEGGRSVMEQVNILLNRVLFGWENISFAGHFIVELLNTEVYFESCVKGISYLLTRLQPF